MKNLVEYILIRLVEFPDEVQVEEVEQEDGLVILTVFANEADYGRIIGKGGAVINAIRQLVKIRSIKEGKRVLVKVATSTEGAA
ncbi:KH domain-containing protein [Microgenomates group bacterium]|nr:KH domain-containing protein [Microgenomates group bacterium]